MSGIFNYEPSIIKGDFPKGAFPISDLAKYFPPGGARRPLALVAFYAPWDVPFVLVPGKPDPDEIMQRISNVMRQYGVKQVMFQARSHGFWVEIK